ncbi:MAG: thiamine diphosphokinase [bacterium]|jgi:thiamine pyrophosphokinase|nr:thiamine diphosphokinase [bacterium]
MGKSLYNKVVIVSNGNIDPAELRIINEKDFIICADGGANFLIETDITPNLIVGDLDSIDDEVHHHYKNKDCDFIEFDTEEDKTDTHLSLEYSLQNIICSEIVILGALGLRFDHTLANLHLLYNAKRDHDKLAEETGETHPLNIRIVSNAGEITVTDGTLKLQGEPGDLVSFIPLTDKVGKIECSGLKFPVTEKSLLHEDESGLSNEMTDNEACITINEGIMMVVKKRKQSSDLLRINSGPAPIFFTKPKGH